MANEDYILNIIKSFYHRAYGEENYKSLSEYLDYPDTDKENIPLVNAEQLGFCKELSIKIAVDIVHRKVKIYYFDVLCRIDDFALEDFISWLYALDFDNLMNTYYFNSTAKKYGRILKSEIKQEWLRDGVKTAEVNHMIEIILPCIAERIKHHLEHLEELQLHDRNEDANWTEPLKEKCRKDIDELVKTYAKLHKTQVLIRIVNRRRKIS